MDLEQLNKSQIVLLTLLVSFVTSIATGIVSVTLMEQAPPAITQTVNRIVERTVEKVIPQEAQVAAAATTVTEKTVVIHEVDTIADAVTKTEAIAVRLFAEEKDAAGYTVETFLGLGVVASSDGLIFADSVSISDSAKIAVVRSDGQRAAGRVVGRDKDAGIVRIQAASTTDVQLEGGKTETKPLSWIAATFMNSSPNLGETVVTLSGKNATRIANGIVTAFARGEGDTIRVIETSIPDSGFVPGSPLITASGEVLGIATSQSKQVVAGGFLASPIVLSYNKVLEEKKETKSAP